ncbi:MAG TPA: DJ-1/PfpI family protein [Pyrinomonadaceae bacterium]|jgi:transcriptional regulator GlxA family with amidase domain
MDTAIVTFDDFTDLDLFILWDLLNRVEAPGWRVRFLGQGGSHTSSTGVEVKMHGALEEAEGADAVLFCSGRGTRRLVRDEDFLGAFRLDESRQLIGAIDSGALLLGALGLLRGRRATTYPSAELKSLLEGMGARVVWESFVREGNVATAAQCLAGQHLAGWVIETLAGAEQKERALKSVAPLDSLGVEL